MYSVDSTNIFSQKSDYFNCRTNSRSTNQSYTGKASRTSVVSALTTKQFEQCEQVWLKLSSVENQTELSNKYADICVQHKQEKKWLLFINADESSLEQLAKKHGVDISKVLCVSFKGKNKLNNMVDNKSAHLDIEQLKRVLSRGNCSAVIMSNASFDETEMTALNNSARLGKTHCVLVKNNKTTQSIADQTRTH